MKKISLLLLLLTAIGCSDSGSDTGTNPDGPLQVGEAPKAGSWYKFTVVPITPTGQSMPGDAFWEIDSIAESGLTVFGKSNVVRMSSTTEHEGSLGHAYFSYAANGDLWVLCVQLNGDTVWNLLPFGSKVTEIRHVDSLIGGEPFISNDTMMYVGTETLAVNGASLSGSTIRMSSYAKTSIYGYDYVLTSNNTMSFSHSIGYYFHQYCAPGMSGTSMGGGRDMKLIDYVVKN